MALIYTIPQSHCVIIERFGKFNRVQKGGIRFKLPFGIENIKCVDDPDSDWGEVACKEFLGRRCLIELTEQQTDTDARMCHTKDNVPVKADASVYWRVTDPRRAVYEVDVLPKAIRDVALNALRANIGAIDLDTVLSERQELNEKIAAQLSKTAAKWGIVYTRIEIQEIKTDDKVAEAMVLQMEAERKRRKKISEAEGDAAATIKIAEADKQATILRAEGRAKALALITEAERKYLSSLAESCSREGATQLLTAQKYLDGFDTISKNPGDKVFIPNSFTGLFSFPANTTDSKSIDQA